MQYALFNGQNRHFLLDATEFSLLKDWQKNQVKELSGFDVSVVKSAHFFTSPNLPSCSSLKIEEKY